MIGTENSIRAITRKSCKFRKNVKLFRFLDFYKRSMRAARQYLSESHIISWTQQWRVGLHRWAGHFSRLAGGKLPVRILNWRSIQWWRENQLQPDVLRHPARLSCWRWEEQLEAYHGPRWRHTAANRALWKANEVPFSCRPFHET